MFVEILITVIIIAFAALILYKNIKKSTSGNCNCNSCSSHCPNYTSQKK